MQNERKRILEVRMIVIVTVDLTAPGLADVIAASGKNSSSVAEIVASEVVSNLESVSYVESAIVSQL